MHRRRFLLIAAGTAAAAVLPGCEFVQCDPNLPGCTEYEGVAQAGETQWDMIRRLWPEYEAGNLAFEVFDEEQGYIYPSESDFDDQWNLTFGGGEQVLFRATVSIT